MKTPTAAPDSRTRFQFCFPELDTLVLVEKTEDRVIIRATRDTFSEARKLCFIHELAAEGFIDLGYRDFAGFNSGSSSVEWLIDRLWLKLDAAATKRTYHFMVRLLLFSTMLWLGLVWLFIR